VLQSSQTFTYDSNGNRTSSTVNGLASTYAYQAGNNRLASVSTPGGTLNKTNTYDLSGNLLGDGANTYTYDARGRLTQAVSAGITTGYKINYENLRVRKGGSTASDTRIFIYDSSGHILGEYDSNGNPVQELIWLGDTPVAVTGLLPCTTGVANCTEQSTAMIWTDHLNTPRELTRVNAAGQHVSMWKWSGLPFGESAPNQNPNNYGPMTFNHRFPGQYYDKETGLHQNWYREYDPKLGKYIESDPLGQADDVNTYRYAKANPISIIDPEGLCGCGEAIARQAISEAMSPNTRERYYQWTGNSCNYAVAGIVQGAGIDSPTRQTRIGGTAPIGAGTGGWGDPTSSLPGFALANGVPQLGDIVARGGHVGIVVRHPGTGELATVSQSSITGRLELTNFGLSTLGDQFANGAVAWRCGC
jgi:RHS repeat-associated protein